MIPLGKIFIGVNIRGRACNALRRISQQMVQQSYPNQVDIFDTLSPLPFSPRTYQSAHTFNRFEPNDSAIQIQIQQIMYEVSLDVPRMLYVGSASGKAVAKIGKALQLRNGPYGQVTGLEADKLLVDQSREYLDQNFPILRSLQYNQMMQVRIKTGDIFSGCMKAERKFDVIATACPIAYVPQQYIEVLKPNGTLSVPLVTNKFGQVALTLFRLEENGSVKEIDKVLYDRYYGSQCASN